MVTLVNSKAIKGIRDAGGWMNVRLNVENLEEMDFVQIYFIFCSGGWRSRDRDGQH